MIKKRAKVKMFDAIIKFIQASFGIWSIFGILGIIVKIFEFQLKKRNARIFIYASACACWALYFLFRGSVASACANVLGLIQSLVFMQREKHKWARSYFWLAFFMALQIANCIINFSNWHDAFPMLANIVGAIAYFVIGEKEYRLLSFFNCIFWLSNSICKVAVLALICDTTSVISAIVGFIRFVNRKKIETNNIEKIDQAI